MRTTSELILMGLLVYALPAHSQTNEVVADSPATVLAESDKRAPTAVAPTAEADSGIAKTAISLRGSSSDGTVAVTLAARPNVLGRNAWGSGSLTFEAPLEDSGRGDFLTTAGFTNKFSATAKYSLIVMNTDISPSESARTREITAKADEACKKDFEASEIALDILARLSGVEQRNALRAAREKACETQLALHQRSSGYLAKYVVEMQGIDIATVNQLAAAPLAKRNLWIINLAAGIGYKEFDYFDPIDFGDRDSQATPYSLSASIGLQPARNAPLLALGYEYMRNFKDAKKSTQCLAGSGGIPQCRYDIFDAPKAEISQTAFVMTRAKLFGAATTEASKGLRPVLELKVAYDFEEKRFGIAAPLYFLLDDDGGLKGGLRFEWQEKGSDPDAKRFGFSVFVAKSFGFLDF